MGLATRDSLPYWEFSSIRRFIIWDSFPFLAWHGQSIGLDIERAWVIGHFIHSDLVSCKPLFFLVPPLSNTLGMGREG